MGHAPNTYQDSDYQLSEPDLGHILALYPALGALCIFVNNGFTRLTVCFRQEVSKERFKQ